MCVTAGVAALIVSVIGAGVSTYAAVDQSNTAKKVAEDNADAQRKTAISAENQAAQQASDATLRAKRVAASGVAAAAAGGVDPSTGTPLTLTGQTAEFGELDSLRIINNANRTAWGYNTQAGIDQYQGSRAQTAGYISGAGTLISGSANAYGSYVKATTA